MYAILLKPIEIISIYSYGQRHYETVVCEAFILDKTKAKDICHSTALKGYDNSMYKRYKVLVRANNKNRKATYSVLTLLKTMFSVCVTDDYYLKHIKYPHFEGDIIELNNCEAWELSPAFNYDIKQKKKSKDILIQASKTLSK